MNFWKITTVVFAAAFFATLLYATARPASAEGQTKLEAAIPLLEGAKRQLQDSKADKAGHRDKALRATEEALDETKKGSATGSLN